jgi:hypothetical protein
MSLYFFSGFHTMGGQDAMEQYKVCIGPNLTCMNDLMNRMGQFNHVEYKGEQVKCRSSCEDQINSLFVTTSSYPNRKEREREREREKEMKEIQQIPVFTKLYSIAANF